MKVRELKELIREIPDHWDVCVETVAGDDIDASPLAGVSNTRWEHALVFITEESQRGQRLN